MTDESGIVVVRRRAEGAGIVGDMVADIEPGQEFAGVAYADMARVG